jgi:hypothetical protein
VFVPQFPLLQWSGRVTPVSNDGFKIRFEDDGGGGGTGVGGGGGGETAIVTAIVAVEVVVPPAPTAVRVYVVVAEGVTVVDVPFTVPIPLFIENEVALLTDQVRSDDCPDVIEFGFAVNELIIGAGGGGVGVGDVLLAVTEKLSTFSVPFVRMR